MGGRTKERTFYIEDCQFGVRLKEFGPAAGQDWARAGPCQGRGAGGGRRWRVRELAQRVPRGVQPMAAPVTSGAGGHTPATPMRAPRRPPVGWLDEGGFVTLTASELSPSSARTRLTGHAARPPEACDSTRLTQSESGVYRHNQLRRLYCPRGEMAPLPFGDTHTPAPSNLQSTSRLCGSRRKPDGRAALPLASPLRPVFSGRAPLLRKVIALPSITDPSTGV